MSANEYLSTFIMNKEKPIKQMILIQQYFHWFLVALARPTLDALLNCYVLIDSSTAIHNTNFFTTKKQLSKH